VTALSQYEREQLARIEATPDAEESLRERVARAMFESEHDDCPCVWPLISARYFLNLADAAIAVMRGGAE
jgi:hypothetical protein